MRVWLPCVTKWASKKKRINGEREKKEKRERERERGEERRDDKKAASASRCSRQEHFNCAKLTGRVRDTFFSFAQRSQNCCLTAPPPLPRVCDFLDTP